MDSLLILGGLVLGVVLVSYILRSQDDEKSEKKLKEYPYHLKDDFLSAAELNFFLSLKQSVGDRAVVLTKVGLGDIFWVKPQDKSKFRAYRNKIDRKHVDFLLCNPRTMQPILGIELDDKSHQRAKRQERDAFVDQVFGAAKLPLIHMPVKHGYMLNELQSSLEAYWTTPSTQGQSVKDDTVCPKCGSPMILRTATKGANIGKKFWGCSNYPNCKTMLPYRG